MSKKIIAKFVGVAMVLSLAVAGVATPAQAVTIEELQAQVNALLAQIATLGGSSSSSSSSCYTYTRDLTLGSTGADVVALQEMLVASGNLVMPTGVSMGYFGALTQSALASYQAANGISPAAGYFGPVTRGAVAAKCATTPTTPSTDSDSSDLQGGAGSISDADFISALNNEEVGEDEEDVEVAGLEIEAEGSDIELRAITLDFDYADTGADDDFEDYASEVSVWFEGEEVARIDADEFNDDNDYSRSVSLDSGAIIEEDETGELIVAVSGVSNLDTPNQGENWNVSFVSVRFQDAQDAIVTDSTTGDIGDTAATDTTTDSFEREFSFESFASASNVELKIASDNDDINDAHVIQLDEDSSTDDVEVLSFTIEIEGNSDVELKDLPVEFDIVSAGTAGDPNDMISSASLVMDGEVVGTENVTDDGSNNDNQTVTFDDLDLMLEAGETYSFVVTVDIKELDGTIIVAGDTIAANIGSTERDAIDAEDESGEDLSDSTGKSGTVTGDALAIFETGIEVELVSAGEPKVTSVDTNTNDDSVLFTIKYTVTAFGGDVWVSESSTGTVTSDSAIVTNGVGGLADDSVLYRIEKAGTATVGSLVSAPDTFQKAQTGATDTGAANGIKIDEGKTVEFTLSVTHTNTTAGDGGQYRMALAGISWEDAAAGADEFLYTFNLDDFVTDYALVN